MRRDQTVAVLASQRRAVCWRRRHDGNKQQGPQSEQDPAQQYRAALAAIDQHSRSHDTAAKTGRAFAELNSEEQDAILKGIEEGSVELEGFDGKKFFENLITDVQQGFFADPLYGGNRNMRSDT